MVELVGDVPINTLEKVNGVIEGYLDSGELAYSLNKIVGGYKAKLFGSTKARVLAEREVVVAALEASAAGTAVVAEAMAPIEVKKPSTPRWV